jgi:hypothetical protein
MFTALPLLSLPQVLHRGAAALIVVALYGLVLTWAVRLAGDEGPTQDGRLTLAPWRHLDLVGLVAAVFFRVAWVLPLEVEVARFRRPWLAVPLVLVGSGLVLVGLGAVAMALRPLAITGIPGEGGRVVSSVLSATFDIAVLTAFWNLIPWPPFTGTLGWGLVRPGAERRARIGAVRAVGTLLLLVVLVSGIASTPAAAITAWMRAAFGY